MNILVLSDLHLHFWNNSYAVNHYKTVMQKLLSTLKFDCIVISGDILESNFMYSNKNPYEFLHSIFNNDYPIICCFGNHEFAYSYIDEVHKFYSSFKDRYNIHYLDIENKFEFNNYNFIGNVFWYDNSLTNNPFSIPDHIVSNWLDSTIKDFIPSKENQKCKEQILNNIDHTKKNILITHTVPHYKLNWFSLNEPESLYNQYSGNKDFLQAVSDIAWSICGHTHKRIMDTIYNINCVNVGNDYLNEKDEIKHYIINTENLYKDTNILGFI